MGFDAYGATADAPDPVAHAINCMLDHVHVIETKMQRMCEAMREMGFEPGEEDLPGTGFLRDHFDRRRTAQNAARRTGDERGLISLSVEMRLGNS